MWKLKHMACLIVKTVSNAKPAYVCNSEVLCDSLFHYISKNQMLYRLGHDVTVLIMFKVCSKFRT